MSEFTLNKGGTYSRTLKEFCLVAKVNYKEISIKLETSADRKTETIELMVERIDEAKKYLDKMKDDLKEI